MKKNKNFFLDAEFECQNTACLCDVDIENVGPGEPPRKILKLYSSNKPLNFAYQSGKGLCLAEKGGYIIEENILGKLLALPSDVKKIDQYIDFFSKYGFFFPLKQDEYDIVDAEDIVALVNRLKATIRLMNAVSVKKYKDMLIHTVFLLYTDMISINDGRCIQYNSCEHLFTKMLHSGIPFPDLTRDRECYTTGYHTFEDSFHKEGYRISRNFFDDIRSKEVTEIPGSDDPLFYNLFSLYTGNHIDSSLKLIIDFFFHLQMEIGIFREIKYKKLTIYKPMQEMSEQLQAALSEIAYSVLADEISHNIRSTRLVCTKELFPQWQMSTFMEALYFSIYFLKKDMQIIKECANPNCSKRFIISNTNRKKKYCSVKCANTTAQRRYRQNHPL